MRSTTQVRQLASISASSKETLSVLDLDNAIYQHRERARAIRAPEKYSALAGSGLIQCYRQRALQTKDIRDIDKALKLYHQILPYLPSTHPLRASCALEISRCYDACYLLTGDPSDLDEAIGFYTANLSTLPIDDTFRFTFHRELGDALGTRFDNSGQPADLTDAIHQYRKARSVGPRREGDDLWSLLNILGCRLLARSRLNSQTSDDVDEALSGFRGALELRKDGGLMEALSLRGLALCHKERAYTEGS